MAFKLSLKSASITGAFFIVIFLFSSCSTPVQVIDLRKKASSIKPKEMELLDVPFYPQKEYQCGPSALATVLVHKKIKTDPDTLQPLVYLPKRKGSLQIEMTATARSFGLVAYPIQPELHAIIKQIQQGNPVLILQNLGFSWFTQWHYAVVVGYDLENEMFILRSGVKKRLIRSFEVIERTWSRSNYWGLVIIPATEKPLDVEPLIYLKAVQQLEEKGHIRSAIQGYCQAYRIWPNNDIPLIGIGNAAYSLNKFTLAENAFHLATKKSPEKSEAWNNLAYSLLATGCYKESLTAIDKAIEISKSNPLFIDSRNEIQDIIRSKPLQNKECQSDLSAIILSDFVLDRCDSFTD